MDDKESENIGSEQEFQLMTSEAFFTSINVETTLNVLRELACQNTTRGHLVEENEREFEAISENISELARQRNELHDLLEIETINANKRRRALQVLPKSFSLQVQGAVSSARQLNSDRILSLQAKLKSLKEQVARVEKRMEELTVDNIKLKPDCELIRKEHDQIIAQLNHRMSMKSSKQIVLNETCDVLRDVQRQTAEIDIGLENLADDLARDKADAAAIKGELLKETQETENQISDVKDKIAVERKVLNSLMEQSTDKAVEIQERRKTISRLENSVTRLEMDAMQLNSKIDRERRGNQKMVEEIDKLSKTKAEEARVYQDKIDVIEKKMKQVLAEKEVAERENDEILRAKEDSSDQSNDAHFRKEALVEEVKEAAKEFQRLKELLGAAVEKTGNIASLNGAIQEKMEVLEENHRATVELYQSQSDELTQHLNKEKGERMKVQMQRDESEKHLETFRAEETKFISNISTRINSAAGKHQKLSDKSLFLSRDTAQKRRKISTLKVKLEIAQSSFRSMKSGLEQDLAMMKKNIEAMGEDIKKKNEFVEEKVPQLSEMKELSERLTDEYNESKNKMLVIRNQEKSLVEQKNRTKLLVEKIRKAVAEIKLKVEASRIESVEQLRREKEAREELEESINQILHKLETLYKSNESFNEARREIGLDFDSLMTAMNSHASHQSKLLEQFREIKGNFSNSWLVTVGMEEASSDHDAKLLDEIRRIQKDTNERSHFLTTIAEQMEFDLEQLTNFVEDVSSRRPKDTRQSRRMESRRKARNQSGTKDAFKPGGAFNKGLVLGAGDRAIRRTVIVQTTDMERENKAIQRTVLVDKPGEMLKHTAGEAVSVL